MDSHNRDQDRSSLGNNPASSSRYIPVESQRFNSPEPQIPAVKRIPLVVVHPNSIVRYGIHHAWSTSPFIHVRGVASSWKQLQLNSAAEHARVGLYGLPVAAEADLKVALAELRMTIADNPQIKWIVMANRHPDSCRQEAIEAGAYGYTESNFSADRLESMVLWVDAGRQVGFESPQPAEHTEPASMTDLVIDDRHRSDQMLAPAQRSPSTLSRLSEREREVLEGLAVGKTNQQIADTLFLSVKTIETYRSRLKQKLGLKDRAEMVAFLRSGPS
ncbi:helix-turn-helix transcriptional regulator [Neorhodopirellula pilleata]|uniref:Transcriptional regulatory protein DevR (DosR) n=1 Tax=Neorhodopirellula pilleata TaxID=2714738 RepID=A0A5C6AV16_9BACT|nr:response regulator transcription factor [Neorhodopirellula pilleata]TWU03281.1 Transcriptional regulatory protein DevR (DosR) [Neorhodopirellula pilleata]